MSATPGRWSGAWRLAAHHAAEHLSSLDPRTDREAILRWWVRWRKSLRRADVAREREQQH